MLGSTAAKKASHLPIFEMWTSPANVSHLRGPQMLGEDHPHQYLKKRSSASMAGETVSLLIAIDSVTRQMRSHGDSKSGSLLSAAGSELAAGLMASSPIDTVVHKLSADTAANYGRSDANNNNETAGGHSNNEDPWTLDQLLSDDQMLSEPMPTWKKYARIILPHVGLILLSVLYVVGGAFIFYQVESPNELAVRSERLARIDAQEQRMLAHLWRLVNDNTTTRQMAERAALEHVDDVSRLLFDAFDTHYINIAHLRARGVSKHAHRAHNFSAPPQTWVDGGGYSWTMTTAIFFTTTLLTTIGYGNLVPVTATGRMFCIFYALFGVPLILITVADIGKFLSEKIIWLYGIYSHAKKRLRLRRRRAVAQRRRRIAAANAITRTLAAAAGSGAAAAATKMVEKSGEAVKEDDDDGEGEETSEVDNEEEDELMRHAEEEENVKHRMRAQLQELGIDNYVSIPIALIAAILLGYMTIGAVLLANWENWRFFDGFYFSFITMTTVGFGDIVPIKQQFFFFDLFYIIVGLAITTMCIDLVGIEYIEKIHYFGRAISGARFALVNVGGKMVRVPDLVRCAYVLHQKYGQKKGVSQSMAFQGAYAPKDLALIRFIDFGALASFESLTSLLSNRFGSLMGTIGVGSRRISKSRVASQTRDHRESMAVAGDSSLSIV